MRLTAREYDAGRIKEQLLHRLQLLVGYGVLPLLGSSMAVVLLLRRYDTERTGYLPHKQAGEKIHVPAVHRYGQELQLALQLTAHEYTRRPALPTSGPGCAVLNANAMSGCSARGWPRRWRRGCLLRWSGAWHWLPPWWLRGFRARCQTAWRPGFGMLLCVRSTLRRPASPTQALQS